MKLIKPSTLPTIKQGVIKELKSNFPLSALHVLQVIPKLAKDLDVQEHIKPWLLNPAGGFRNNAAQILHEAG